QKVMDSHKDITFISTDEMDRIAADRMVEIGVTDKIGSGAYLEFKDIDFDREYVHDISADKYQSFASIQEELEVYEKLSVEFDESDIDNMPQQVANYTSYRWYDLWDNELNDLWDRIVGEISEDKKQALVEEQREWIKRKDLNVKEAGSDFEGGTMQPLLENCAAERFTRKRCYELAAILAEIRGEDFQVPGDVAESYADVDHTLEEMFEKFEGQWITDQERGACIGVEKSDTCDMAPEGSKWTVWETGGDVISDLDVYSFTDYAIIFKVPHDSYDSYYKLQFNWDNEVELLYGNSLEELYDYGV
ncbi:MAG: DUF1311 domain-containing protein, partial [Spirochaetales bacterium]|nr:DUF1311 domain-containing protein [Spirochaetales bacterium]